MDQTRTVVLYGDSLSLSAIAAGLEVRPGWRVIRVDPAFADLTEHLRRLHPDVVLFDLAAAQPEAVISLLREMSGLQLIGVDLASHRALVLSGQQPGVHTSDDLVHLIEAQSARDSAWDD